MFFVSSFLDNDLVLFLSVLSLPSPRAEGFPDYNCFINADKILTNFPVVQSPAGVILCTEPGGKLLQ